LTAGRIRSGGLCKIELEVWGKKERGNLFWEPSAGSSVIGFSDNHEVTIPSSREESEYRKSMNTSKVERELSPGGGPRRQTDAGGGNSLGRGAAPHRLSRTRTQG